MSVCLARLCGGVACGAVHQRRHSHRRGGRLLQTPHPGEYVAGRTRDAGAGAAGAAVRAGGAGAAGVRYRPHRRRPVQHPHRHPGWTVRDGRVFGRRAHTLEAATADPAVCSAAQLCSHCGVGHAEHLPAADFIAGDTVAAAAVCHRAGDSVHRRCAPDERRLRERPMGAAGGLVGGGVCDRLEHATGAGNAVQHGGVDAAHRWNVGGGTVGRAAGSAGAGLSPLVDRVPRTSRRERNGAEYRGGASRSSVRNGENVR
eukprot:ctg_791.g306